jgi:hypothetical protein
VVYATFALDGKPAGHAVDQLEAYASVGFQTLVVDTSPVLTRPRRLDWTGAATRWVRRPNVGYDFGSYRHGLTLLNADPGIADERLEVIFTNDSCLGPFMPIGKVLETFMSIPTNTNAVFGITDSNEITYHLQSYWLYFRPAVLPLAERFFSAMPLASDRDQAIAWGELALSRFLCENGCVLLAFSPIESVLSHFARFHTRGLAFLELGVRRLFKRPKYSLTADLACLKFLRGDESPALNPTLAFGLDMARKGMSPFIKRSLLRDNPYRDPRVPCPVDGCELNNAAVSQLLGTKTHRPV